jgi:hypothetical protein
MTTNLFKDFDSISLNSGNKKFSLNSKELTIMIHLSGILEDIQVKPFIIRMNLQIFPVSTKAIQNLPYFLF